MPDTKSSLSERPIQPAAGVPTDSVPAVPRPAEVGGRESGLDPVRYGDWEKDGRCIDF